MTGSNATLANDYYKEKDGVRFAGIHLLLDLWGCELLDDPRAIEEALTQAAKDARATVLNTSLVPFAVPVQFSVACAVIWAPRAKAVPVVEQRFIDPKGSPVMAAV
jgi:hypothetical protein